MEVVGLNETLLALKQELEKKQKQAETGVMRAGQAYQRDVQVRAPVDKGQYRGTIRSKPGKEGNDPYAIIGTPMPQACRLEFGFDNKTDRLGRTFHQKPRPHFRPPMEQNKEKYHRIIKAELDRP
jgi:HK97 gp10 family phage protein